jgi:hypothetical protein
MDVKSGIDKAVETAVDDIRKRPKKVSTNHEIAQVGTVSANADQELGRMLAQMQKVGNEGVITVEKAKSLDTDVVEDILFDRGYISPYFVTTAEKRSASSRARLCTSNVRRANSELGPSRLHDFDEDAGGSLIRVRERARRERSFKSCRSLAFGGQPIPGGIEPSRLFCLDFLPGRHNLAAGYGHATGLQAASDDHRGRGAHWLRDDFF